MQISTMNLSPRLSLIIPKAGLRHFGETYLIWSSVGFIATLIGLPIIYLSNYWQCVRKVAQPLRRLTYTFFLVAFDEGALMIGILIANFVHTGDKTKLLASKSFLFSNIGLFAIISLVFLNSILWLLGEAIYNRNDGNISGIVEYLMTAPIKYTAPLYTVTSAGIIYWVVNQ
jgi:hypothetical protein